MGVKVNGDAPCDPAPDGPRQSGPIVPPVPAMRTETFSLEVGAIEVRFPDSLTLDDFRLVERWMEILARKLGRRVPCAPGQLRCAICGVPAAVPPDGSGVPLCAVCEEDVQATIGQDGAENGDEDKEPRACGACGTVDEPLKFHEATGLYLCGDCRGEGDDP